MSIDVTTLGEVLIDFTDCGINEQTGMRLFEQNPGGAPANVATAVSRLGGKSAFIGRVGNDMHGTFLIDTLSHIGVDTSGISRDDQAFTTLAFVALSDSGERTFSFARKPGADTRLRPTDVPTALLQNTRILHFGSLSLTDEPAHHAILHAIQVAREHHAIIAYDPNDRPLLWPSRAQARETMRSVLPLVDVIKLSEEECEILTGLSEPKQAAMHLLDMGIQCVVITLGSQGALVCTASEPDFRLVPGFSVPVTDTTGAGDAFWGGFLTCLSRSHCQPATLSLQEAAEFARYGNAVAACNVQKRGAIPAMPSEQQVQTLLQTR